MSVRAKLQSARSTARFQETTMVLNKKSPALKSGTLHFYFFGSMVTLRAGSSPMLLVFTSG